MKYFEQIQNNTLRCEASNRGGGIEISLSFLGKKCENEKITAYQNYLGGGILGRVCNSCTISNWQENKKVVQVALELKEYFHNLTNHVDDEWENQSFEQNQRMDISAF